MAQAIGPDIIKERFLLNDQDINSYSPLTLAYIGDCVYDLVVRSVITLKGNCPANVLNKKTVRYVKAVSQAKIYDHFMEDGILNEEEASVLRRGRNAKSPTVAKHASVGDYRKATGVEALIGYLYLKGEGSRLIDLMKQGMDVIQADTK